MNNSELIKDGVILANIIQVMRLATNKVVSRTSDLIPESDNDLGDIGSAFHAATLAARLSLSEGEETTDKEVEEKPTEEPTQEPQTEEPEQTESEPEEDTTSENEEEPSGDESVDDGDNWD